MASLLYVAALLISAHVGVANASEVTPVCKVVLQDNLMHAELLGHKHVDDDEVANALGWLWILIIVPLLIALLMWGHGDRTVVQDGSGKVVHTVYHAKPYTKVPELRMV